MSIDANTKPPLHPYSGSISFSSYGVLQTTSYPVNSIVELIAANDQYHDNVLTVVNDSANPGTKISELGGENGVGSAGTGYRDGLYENVYLTALTGSGTHARANLVVIDGVVRRCDIIDGGQNFSVGDVVGISNDQLGGSGSGFSSAVASLSGTRGNAATRYLDPVTKSERCAIGYNSVNNQQFQLGFPLLYLEIGNISPRCDTWDTHFGIVNTHTPGALRFPGTAYRVLTVRADTGEIQIASHDQTVWATFSDERVARITGTLAVVPGSSVNPEKIGEVVFELTNDTTLTFKAKGSDGKVRSVTLTLL
jgi:hypothetical protein